MRYRTVPCSTFFYFFYIYFVIKNPHRVRSRTALAMLWRLALSSPAVYTFFILAPPRFIAGFFVFRLGCFGVPLRGALVVFVVLLDGHYPQDVATSLGGGELDK